MSNFVIIKKEQFESYLPKGFKEVETNAKEYVYEGATDSVDVGVRIYSSVDIRTNQTRDSGKDAIRIVYWDILNDRPLGKGRKIYRVEGATNIGDRIQERIRSFMFNAYNQTVIDFGYVRAVLNSTAVNWSGFAQSLLDNLDKFDNLTDKQLAYVLGEKNPKGKDTFEATVKKKDSNFLQKYLDSIMEEGKDNETKTDEFERAPEDDGKQEEKVIEESKTTAVENVDILNLIPTSQYKDYTYPFHNFNPVQSAVLSQIEFDTNMIIGANTSAGKTVCAELIMDFVLRNEKVIYLSPLKSLTQEKYDDWQKRFPNEEITILTGDYTLSETMKEKLAKSNLIVMTSEMADSRTRRMESEKNYWLKQVGLVVVDECFPGSTKVRVAENYEVSISEIYRNPSFSYVISYNKDGKVLEKKKIIRKVRRKVSSLVRILYKIEGKIKTLVCTGNHRIWTSNRGYVMAKDLREEDTLKLFPILNKNYCEICKRYWEDTSGGFSHHYYLQHTVKTNMFTCTKCKRNFRRIEDEKCHKCPSPIRCTICNNQFFSKLGITEHYRIKHDLIISSICKVCNRPFGTKEKLYSHVVQTHRDKKWWETKIDKWRKNSDPIKRGKAISGSPKHKKAMKRLGKLRRGKNNPIYLHNGQGLKKIKKIGTERWNNLSEKEKQEQIKRFINAPVFRKNGALTSLEAKINNQNFRSLYYTGDGSYFVTFKNGKRKNPDFKVKGQRKVIEVGDFEFWHNKNEVDEVVKNYEKIGYRCLYLTDKDINNNWSETILKIETFIKNHEAKVIMVKGYGNSKIEYVYNIEVEDNHNYIANDVLVSNCHILTTSRGHAVETGIMRFTSINRKARILFLSATMPNVDELGRWLTLLNGKKTEVIYSTWRPVELQVNYVEYPITFNRMGWEDYWASQEQKRSKAVELAMSKPDEKFLIFCHDKGTGRDIVKRLKEEGVDTVFHNADLDLKDRLDIENSFQNRSNGIRVLVSTSTLAWGRNLPARNVIIVGVHRGLDSVDELDIIQMSGRAGRYGIDDAGFVFLIIPEGSTSAWKNIFANPRPVLSVLNSRSILAFHVLAEVQNRVITQVGELLSWYKRSLAGMQSIKPFDRVDAEGLILDLINMEMLTGDINRFSITGLGKVSAWLYFSPYDVYAWYRNFGRIFEDPFTRQVRESGMSGYHQNRATVIDLTDETLAWALADIPSNDLGYIRKDLAPVCDEWRWLLKNRGIVPTDALPSVIGAYNCLADQSDDNFSPYKRATIYDIDRQCQALSLIDGMYSKWSKELFWKILPTRVKYGIPEEMVELVRIPGIGGVRARKLWDRGFRTIADVADMEKKRELMTLFKLPLVKKIQTEAKRLLKEKEDK